MERKREQVVLETGRYRVEGEVLPPPEGYKSRLSDHLNEPERDFLIVLDAVLDSVRQPRRHEGRLARGVVMLQRTRIDGGCCRRQSEINGADVGSVDGEQAAPASRGSHTAEPQLGSSSATRKEEPQPHDATTFGLVTSKPEPWKLSVQTTSEPST